MDAKLRRRLRQSVTGAAALVAVTASVAATPGVDPAPAGAVTDHVIIISVDGLRPDAIAAFEARTLERLIREGSASLEAQTVLPSKTLPSHASMLTGVGPAVHGVTWNSHSDEHGVIGVPTIFELARERGFRTAAFFSKSKFHHLIRPGSLDHAQTPDATGGMMATRTVQDAVAYLEHERPSLLFVHVAEPDFAGHSIGWMSFAYGWAVKRADGAIDKLLEAADEAYGADNYTVIVTADHGGHGRSHGSEDVLDTTIPWIVWGEGVEPGRTLPAGIRTMDTGATALWLLGIAVPAAWEGKAVAAAFTPVAQIAAADAASVVPAAAAAPAGGSF